MKKELFEDIQIINRKGGINPLKSIHTIGWKFEYKGNKYGNFISDQRRTGKYSTVMETDDDGNSYEHTFEIMKTVPIKPKEEIALMKNMIEVMEALIKKKEKDGKKKQKKDI